MTITFATATEADVAAIASLRTAAAAELTRIHGKGYWSSSASDKAVLRGISDSRVIVARAGARIVATVRLATNKPSAIDPAYFADVKRPLYLHDLAVDPKRQREGIGGQVIEEVVTLARAWPSDSIRLDAWDAPAGAGEFYAKAGFREVGRAKYRTVPLVYFEMVF